MLFIYLVDYCKQQASLIFSPPFHYWNAEQEDRGSIPGLATWIFGDWFSPASKSSYGWKIAKSLKQLTNQPTLLELKTMNVYKWDNTFPLSSICTICKDENREYTIFAQLYCTSLLGFCQSNMYSLHQARHHVHSQAPSHFEPLQKRHSLFLKIMYTPLSHTIFCLTSYVSL